MCPELTELTAGDGAHDQETLGAPSHRSGQMNVGIIVGTIRAAGKE
jgi:hypothetical protein